MLSYLSGSAREGIDKDYESRRRVTYDSTETQTRSEVS